jgi:phosphatidylglycerol:prolipoprotein diacylglycerol transferase
MFHLHTIDPIALQLGPLGIHWYGLMYLLGLAAGWWLGLRRVRAGRLPVSEHAYSDLMFYAMLGVVLGGRIGYICSTASAGAGRSDQCLAHLGRRDELPRRLLGVLAAALVVVAPPPACISSTRWISSRRWCRPGWASGVLATTSAGTVGHLHRQALGRDLPEIAARSVLLDGCQCVACRAVRRRRAGCVRPPSLAAVPGGAGRTGDVHRAVVVLAQAAAALRRVGLFALLYGVFRFLVEFVREPTNTWAIWRSAG